MNTSHTSISVETSNSDSSMTLEMQIRETELAIRERQRLVANRIAHVGQNIRKKITSPIALLAAFGGGFIVDRILAMILILRRRAKKSSPGVKTRPGLFARIMGIAVLVRSLLAALPTDMFRRIASLDAGWPRTRPRPPPVIDPGSPSNHNFYT